jgi:hypothetical protein
MDINTDEVRRQLRASQHDQEVALPVWKQTLSRVFSPGSGVSHAEKAHLLGVPTRRQALKIGGATVIGAAILAACGSDDDDSGTSGTTDDSTSGSGSGSSEVAGDSELDLTLLRTATSLEIAAVNTYQAAIDSGLVTTMAIADAAVLFQEQHQEHADLLSTATTDAGGEAYTEPNPFVQENVIDPALEMLTDETSVVTFALQLENVAAQTYAFAAGALSTPAFRQAIMTIGGVEARHAAVLAGVLEEAQVPNAFLPTDEAVGEDAFV